MTKTESLTQSLTQAISRLEEALALPADNSINQDATIQRFEFTFELSWKLMQAELQDQRIETGGAKDILRKAARYNLISEFEPWNQFLQARNQTAHTYNADQAKRIYNQIKDFPAYVHKLLSYFEQENNS